MLSRYSENGQPFGVDTGEKTEWLLLWSPGTLLYTLVELYFGNVFEMAGHLTVILGRGSAQLQLIHIIVLKCVSSCETLQITCIIGDTLLIGLEMILKERK